MRLIDTRTYNQPSILFCEPTSLLMSNCQDSGNAKVDLLSIQKLRLLWIRRSAGGGLRVSVPITNACECDVSGTMFVPVVFRAGLLVALFLPPSCQLRCLDAAVCLSAATTGSLAADGDHSRE